MQEKLAMWTAGAVALLYVADNCRELYQERHLVNAIDYPKAQLANWQLFLLKLIPLKLASRLWGFVNSFQLPIWTRNFLIGAYCSYFGANLEEAEKPLLQYKNLAEFFGRKLKPRARPVAFGDLVAPCDGQVLSFGRVDPDGFIEQIKGVKYRAKHLIGVDERSISGDAPTAASIQAGWSRFFASWASYLISPFYSPKPLDLYQIVVYLRPGDYHRFHSPCNYKIDEARHFEGELLSVSPLMTRMLPGLFSLNERVALLGRWKHGFMSMVAVGATNVGSIEFHFRVRSSLNSAV
jgi:phosphatidylserine decarboxylase